MIDQSVKTNLLEKEEQEQDNRPKKASFFKIQFYDTAPAMMTITAFGILGALVQSILFPIMNMLWGDTFDGFYDNTDIDKFVETTRELCLKYVFVGVLGLIASLLMYTCWEYLGIKIANRIKRDYFRTVLAQEQLYFDQQNTFELSTKIQSQMTTIENGVKP